MPYAKFNGTPCLPYSSAAIPPTDTERPAEPDVRADGLLAKFRRIETPGFSAGFLGSLYLFQSWDSNFPAWDSTSPGMGPSYPRPLSGQ